MNLLEMFSGDKIATLEADAKAFIANAQKVIADVIESNGNVLSTVEALARDFGELKAMVEEVRQIVADVKTISAGTAVAVSNPTPAVIGAMLQSTTTGAPSAFTAQPAAVVPVASTTGNAPLVEHVPSVVERIEATFKSLDPFAAKPLTKE